MKNKKDQYLPLVNDSEIVNDNFDIIPDIKGDLPCPCCEFITIPMNGDVSAYICPVCFWEMDMFIQSHDEPSDQNHGLTLSEAKFNYLQYKTVLPALKESCRPPKKHEYPK